MDALKRAEQAKEQNQGDALLRSTPNLVLEPEASSTPRPQDSSSDSPSPATVLPELTALESLDDEFLAHAQQPPLRRKAGAPSRPGAPLSSGDLSQSRMAGTTHSEQTIVAETAAREAVRNAFAVKQPPTRDRTILLAAGIAGSLAIVAIGTYVWLQLRPTQGFTVTKPPAASSSSAPTTAVISPSSLPAVDATPRAAGSMATLTRVEDPRRPLVLVAAPATRGIAMQQESGASQARFAAETIQIAKSRPEARPAANDGYLAFQAGDISAAKAAYARLLETDSRNVDALHGLAAIALREGRIGDAEAAYLRILDLDPRDAAANAGLLGIREQSDPIAGESRIKNLLASQPDMHVLSFALGNVYARQNRWSEAQQAYFRAHNADSDNPDYLFNLAISLDQLHQPRLAAQYYGQALKAAEHRPAAFDQDRVISRLRDLQR